MMYTFWRIMLFYSREREEFQKASYFLSYPEMGSHFLKDNNAWSFQIYFNQIDGFYDNDDNPYVKIKLHKYTNMDHSEDYYPSDPKETRYKDGRDEIVPIKPCFKEDSSFSIH